MPERGHSVTDLDIDGIEYEAIPDDLPGDPEGEHPDGDYPDDIYDDDPDEPITDEPAEEE